MARVQSKDDNWVIEFSSFYQGQGPSTHLNSLSELGNSGHYSVGTNIDVTVPEFVTQGPGLANLTNGTQAGAITETTNYILDHAVTGDVTYGIGATKLQKISSTAVTNSGGVFPHSITGATDGESVADFQGALYYFYNKASGADIGKYDLNVTFDDDWGSTVPTGAAALQSAPHPWAKKEDILLFGNGRYVGTYISATNTLAPTKLDFGTDAEVADVQFHANQWYIGVNKGVTSGTNRTTSQIYLYDGGAINSILSDEVAVGLQKIGFLEVKNGTVFVCYKDASGINAYGYVSGRTVVPLVHFTGNLPTYEKKTLLKEGFTAFESSGLIYVVGYATPSLPFSLSQYMDGGYATCGALAAPFGTLMVSSTDGGSNFKLAQASGYDTTCTWKSIIHDFGGRKGTVDEVRVLTNTGGSGASCSLTFEYNQAASTSTAKTLSASTRWHKETTNLGVVAAEDIRLCLSWSAGSASNPLKVRRVLVRGHFTED